MRLEDSGRAGSQGWAIEKTYVKCRKCFEPLSIPDNRPQTGSVTLQCPSCEAEGSISVAGEKVVTYSNLLVSHERFTDTDAHPEK